MHANAARILTLFSIACAAIILMITAASAQESVPDADSGATRQVIEEQIAAFKAGEHARAYSYAAPNIRRVFPTVDQFMAMVQTGYMPLYAPQAFVFGRNALISGQVHQEVIVTDASGKQWQAVYTLVRQDDGTWKISGVKLNPYNGVTA